MGRLASTLLVVGAALVAVQALPGSRTPPAREPLVITSQNVQRVQKGSWLVHAGHIQTAEGKRVVRQLQILTKMSGLPLAVLDLSADDARTAGQQLGLTNKPSLGLLRESELVSWGRFSPEKFQIPPAMKFLTENGVKIDHKKPAGTPSGRLHEFDHKLPEVHAELAKRKGQAAAKDAFQRQQKGNTKDVDKGSGKGMGKARGKGKARDTGPATPEIDEETKKAFTARAKEVAEAAQRRALKSAGLENM